MKLVPLTNKVIVRRDEAEEKSPGGIVLPDAAKEKPRRGRVVAVGPGATRKDGTKEEMPVTEGDRILFSTYAGHDVTVDGEQYLIITPDSILGKIV